MALNTLKFNHLTPLGLKGSKSFPWYRHSWRSADIHYFSSHPDTGHV